MKRRSRWCLVGNYSPRPGSGDRLRHRGGLAIHVFGDPSSHGTNPPPSMSSKRRSAGGFVIRSTMADTQTSPRTLDIASCPVSRPTTCMCQGQDHDVIRRDLIRNPERKAIESGHAPSRAVAPLRGGLRESGDQLGNCEPMDSKGHRRARLSAVAHALDIRRLSSSPRWRRQLRHRAGRFQHPTPLPRRPPPPRQGCGSLRVRVAHAPRPEAEGSRQARRYQTLPQSSSFAGGAPR
jgi:hypothetical protein